MKKIATLLVVSVVLVVASGCREMMARDAYLPAGAKACFSDADCGQGQYCGFVLDSYAHCRGGAGSSELNVNEVR